MKALSLAILAALGCALGSAAQNSTSPTAAVPGTDANGGPVIVVQYSNAQLSPSHWELTIRPDGSGHFQSVMGTVNDTPGRMRTPSINRDVQLSQPFAASVFQTAKHHSNFGVQCESRLKVAYQGDKTLSYSGPDGKGSCTFNYSKDREIQLLADNAVAVAQTIIEGQRLEMLLQHDPLGLDKEIQGLYDAAQSGRAQQLCVIKSILQKLADDDRVLDLVRKRARTLLARADT